MACVPWATVKPYRLSRSILRREQRASAMHASPETKKPTGEGVRPQERRRPATSQPTADEDADRLSALPDCLLHTVMSFLPARQAVQTCALSWRWRDLWRSMPCLDIDDHEFRLTMAPTSSPASMAYLDIDDDHEFRSTMAPTSSPAGSTPRLSWEKLENFTTNLLFAHNAPFLDRFRLHLPKYRHIAGNADVRPQIKRWILSGFRYRPTVLQITIGFIVTIVRFKLPFLGAASARRLKTLHLSGLVLDVSFGECIRSWCPVLEAMELKKCTFESNEIVCDTPKSLAIDDCCASGHRFEPIALAVMAPKLTSLGLRFSVFDFTVSLVDQMDSLVKASICQLSGHVTNFDENNLSSLLGSLLNVENLSLSWSLPLEQHSGKSTNVPTFQKLTTLRFYECDLGQNLHTLPSFLQNAPNLEKVILENCKIPDNLRKRKRKLSVNKRKLPKLKSVTTFESPALKLMRITYKDDDIKDLIELLLFSRRKLENNTIILTKL